MDETQELNYPAIMKAILKTGFEGYVAQEFIPAGKDKVASLIEKNSSRLCLGVSVEIVIPVKTGI